MKQASPRRWPGLLAHCLCSPGTNAQCYHGSWTPKPTETWEKSIVLKSQGNIGRHVCVCLYTCVYMYICMYVCMYVYPGPFYFSLFLRPLCFIIACQGLRWDNGDNNSLFGEGGMFMVAEMCRVLILYVFMFVYMISQKRVQQTALLKVLLHKQKDLDFKCSLTTLCLWEQKLCPTHLSVSSAQNMPGT